MREAERVLASGLQDRLTEGLRRDAQAILLQEVALAAVDLYSGRLIRAEGDALPRNSDPVLEPVNSAEPVQIMVIGQIGAGKSSLINALANQTLLETDAAPTTTRPLAVRYAEGVTLVDTPGLDGSAERRDTVLTLVREADLVLWLHRVNRPGRAADADLLAALAGTRAAAPDQRWAPILHLASAADLAGFGPEQSPRAAAEIARHLHLPEPALPVSALGDGSSLAALRARIEAALSEARMTRLARLRRQAAQGAGLRGNLARAAKGASALARRWTQG